MAQRLGVLLDTSVPIKTQRTGGTEAAMLREVRVRCGSTALGISTVALTELLVGARRGTAEAQKRRQEFIAQMMLDVPTFPYSLAISELAGRIGGEQAAIGQTIPPVDLMIGVTALFLNFSILTANVRHFRMIPNLHVIPF